MDEIIKIIYDNSSNETIINENDINKIFEIFIFNDSLDAYIKKVNIDNYYTKSLACYYSNKKEIYVNFKFLLYSVANKIINNNLSIDSGDKFFLMNLYILKILLHELQHVKQEKFKNDNKNSIETRILIESDKCERYYKSNNMYGDLLYNCNPIERQAELNALSRIIYVSEEFANSKLKDYFKCHFNKRITQNYTFFPSINYPALIYFKNYINDEFIELLDYSFNHNFKRKLEYGLKISEKEYNIIKNIDF